MKILFVTLLVLAGFATAVHSQQLPTTQDYMQAAQDALQNNDYTTAIQDYLLAIKADPKNWEAFQNLGGCYIQLRKMDDAKTAYQQSLQLNPNNPSLQKFYNQVWGGATPVPTVSTVAPTPTATIVVTLAPIVSATPTPTFFSTVVINATTPSPTATQVYVYTLVNTPVPVLQTTTPTHVEVFIPPIDLTNNKMAAEPTAEPLRPPFAGAKPYYFQALPRYNLPDKNTVTFDFGGAIWFGSPQNFNDYFGPNIAPAVTAKTGWDLNAGADYALVNEFQIGLHLEGLISPVLRSQQSTQPGDFIEWDSYAIGLALSTKYLIPLNSAMSLIFHLEGGYYTLVGTQIVYNQGSAGTLGLAGSALGFMPEIQMEFFQVADKSLALDFGLGYRFLNFTSLTGSSMSTGAVNNPNNGQPAYDDFSGLRTSLSIRFVH